MGWGTVQALAAHHEVWALTRVNNRPAIERETTRIPMPSVHFVYYDLPRWARWWKHGERGVQLYYYLWQLGAGFTALRLHRGIRFDVAHHLTFVKYWTPSVLAWLRVPFVWGPVGGGESIPSAFRRDLGPIGAAHEVIRDLARWVGEHDPFVRLTARRSAVTLATTPATADRLLRLRARNVRILSQLGLPDGDLSRLAGYPPPAEAPLRFITIGNLFRWKGVHLALRAFAQAGLDAEYWVVGDGPERHRLQHQAEALGIASRARFWGRLPREEAWEMLARSHVLVFPGMRDSGGTVCLEAMAMGRPVICLKLGGPAEVTMGSGIQVPARAPAQAVRDLAEAMRCLSRDPVHRQRLADSGRQRIADVYRWEEKVERINAAYREAVALAAKLP
ncbi:MAG TPA: glycosyltransferase [bacterium]|nr:glycosyltransferase [bacterium]